MHEVAIETAFGYLHSHTCGMLRFDGHGREIRFVFSADGKIVASVMVAMLEAAEPILFVPDESDEAMQIQISLEEFTERGEDEALCDRWRIYHGRPEDVRWAILYIDAAKFEGAIFDGDALTRPNPLTTDEPAFCKEANARNSGQLRQLCKINAEVVIDEPTVVGVDPFGFDVRGRFEVYRVIAPRQMETIDDARQIFADMIEHAGNADVSPA